MSRTALRALSLAAVHLTERGCLCPDVAGEQVELVGWHVQFVVRVAALVRNILDHQRLSGRLHGIPTAARHFSLGQLEELVDAVRLVHHEVAGLQLQRVDYILAPARELLHLAGVVAGGAPVELALTEDDQVDLRQFEASFDGCLLQLREAGVSIRRKRLDRAG